MIPVGRRELAAVSWLVLCPAIAFGQVARWDEYKDAGEEADHG